MCPSSGLSRSTWYLVLDPIGFSLERRGHGLSLLSAPAAKRYDTAARMRTKVKLVFIAMGTHRIAAITDAELLTAQAQAQGTIRT